MHKLRLRSLPGELGCLVLALLEGKGDVIAGRFTATESRRSGSLTAETFPTATL
jgi:hypothetical protein